MEAKTPLQSEPQSFDLSLRVRHPSIDPAEISSELKVEADHSFRAGDPRPSRSGISSVHAESYWLGALAPAERPEEISIRELPWSEGPQERLAAAATMAAAATRTLGWAIFLRVTRFLNAHAGLFRRIRAEGGEVSLLVAILPSEVSSFSLGPEVTRILGDLGITIEFELADDLPG